MIRWFPTLSLGTERGYEGLPEKEKSLKYQLHTVMKACCTFDEFLHAHIAHGSLP